MVPVLFADRFSCVRPGRAIDLATGEPAWIRARTFTNHRARDGWLTRCAALSAVSHPHLIALADFGAAGSDGYFEAWDCPPPPQRAWRPRDPATASALSSAVGLLFSRRIDAGRLRWTRVLDVSGRPALCPIDDGEGGADSIEGQAALLGRMLQACDGGLEGRAERARLRPAAVPPPAARELADLVERVCEVLDTGVSGRPRAVRLAIPPATARQAVLAVARCARLRGYVPVSPRMLRNAPPATSASGWREALDGRHVLVLHLADEGLLVESGMFFLSVGVRDDRPHVWLTLADPAAPRALRRGRPGSIIGRETGGAAAASWWRGPSVCVRVSEESAPYSADAVVGRWTPLLVGGARPVDARARAILAAGAAGRHAQVERWLREAVGRSVRRHDDAGAGEAFLALGRLLLLRGQFAEAVQAFQRAHGHFETARLAARAVCAGAFLGLALTDGGQFRESESALRAALVAAGALGEAPGASLARQGLARCLIWQGRFDEAIDCLRVGPAPACHGGRPDDDPVNAEWRRLGTAGCARERPSGGAGGGPDTVSALAEAWPIGAIDPDVAHACLQARATIAAGDLAAAGRASADARAHAARSRRPADIATACRARALLFAALGDLPATQQQIEEGLEAARRAHDPLRAIRLRLLLADALLRDGRDTEAKGLLARLARLDARRLPVVVSRPLERLARGELDDRPGRPVVAAFRGASGGAPRDGGAVAWRASLAEAVVDVLGICQAVDDERDALRKVAAALRGRVRAASVACLACDEDRPGLVVSDGSGQPAESVAVRAVDSGLVIPPTSSRTGLEAAVPIRYADTVIGAITCRWAADLPPDWAQAGALLEAASAAVAPCVRAVLDRRATPAAETAAGEILGVSREIGVLRGEIARAAPAPFNVVIEGESGSGKELVARAIHRLGPRGHRPLCALNCAALTDELIEAELFGHARGAFTGAVSERKGLFEEAHLGTLVLDEVGELTLRAQAKLLRAIQEGEVRRLGENLARAVDVRIVAATNRALRAAVEAGTFRRDLLYRLEVIRIVVPPLRARVEDIPVLAAHFWRQATGRVGSRSTLAPATLAALARYDWPGNVRELQNVMAALAVSAGRRGSVGPDRLPEIIAREAAAQPDARSLDDARRAFETAFVRAALARAGGRRAQAALDLRLTRQGLAKLMTRLGIE